MRHSSVIALGCVLVLACAAVPGRSGMSPEDAAALERAERETADRVRTKVVVLKIQRETSRAAATGFLVRPNIVISAAHAFTTESRVTAWVNGVAYPARVLGRHPEHDLVALALRAPELALKPVVLADETASIKPGEPMIVLAGPAQGPTAMGDPTTRVTISARFRERIQRKGNTGKPGVALAFDGSVERGDSGSPIVRVRDSRVVGILSSRELPDAGGVSRSCYAVPIEALRPWLDTLPPPNAPAIVADGEFYLERAGRGK